MKKILIMLVLIINLFANESMLKETPYRYVTSSIGKGKPFFLEIGAKSCRSCQIMSKMLYPITKKHPEYQIHFINVKKEREVALKLGIRMIPTQIIYDANGEEVYRNIGVLSSQKLSNLINKYFKE